jgi:hypothetical protein
MPHTALPHTRSLADDALQSLSSVLPRLAANGGGAVHDVRAVRPRPVQVAALDGVALALLAACRVRQSGKRAALAVYANAVAR